MVTLFYSQDYWEEQGDDAEPVDFEEWDEEFGEETPRARLGELKDSTLRIDGQTQRLINSSQAIFTSKLSSFGSNFISNVSIFM